MAAVHVELVEDRGASEVYEATDETGTQVTRFELAKPDGPAVMYARRVPGGRLEIGWKDTPMPGREPRMLPDTAAVLRAAGLRDQIHPIDAVAFVHPDRASFDRSAAANSAQHGNDVHGPFVTADGLVAVVDLRRQLEAAGCPPTDPADPDSVKHPRHPAVLPDTAAVLRAAGLRDQIHPLDAVAMTYPSLFYFHAWSRVGQAAHGTPTFGPYAGELDGRIVGVTDLRPNLRAAGYPVVDPAEPDDTPAKLPPGSVVHIAGILDPVRSGGPASKP